MKGIRAQQSHHKFLHIIKVNIDKLLWFKSYEPEYPKRTVLILTTPHVIWDRQVEHKKEKFRSGGGPIPERKKDSYGRAAAPSRKNSQNKEKRKRSLEKMWRSTLPAVWHLVYESRSSEMMWRSTLPLFGISFSVYWKKGLDCHGRAAAPSRRALSLFFFFLRHSKASTSIATLANQLTTTKNKFAEM
jgi:hypothetical protein